MMARTVYQAPISDLLHSLKIVAFDRQMTAVPNHDISVPTRTQREPAAYRRKSRFLPRCRAVARSRRPHRNRCYHRVTNRPRSLPPRVCWGPTSHRFRSSFRHVRPQQKYSVGNPVRPQSSGFLPQNVRSTLACSLLGSDRVSEHSSLTGRRGVCARISITGDRRLNSSRTHPTSSPVVASWRLS
jgi:hypothetical protein